jgi:hypothetical protein
VSNDKTNALACKAKEQLTQRPLLMSEVNLIQQMKSDCNRRKTIKHLHYEIMLISVFKMMLKI